MLFPHPELSPRHVYTSLVVFRCLSLISLYPWNSHTCAYYLGLVKPSCVSSPSVTHQLVSLAKGSLFLLYNIFGFLHLLSWLLSCIFHCFLLTIAMIISYYGVFWLGQLKRLGINHSIFSACESVRYHPCIFQTCFPLLVNIVHVDDIICLWIT